MSSSGSTETHSVSVSNEKKTYMVLDHNGTHEYDLTVVYNDEGKEISLYLSNGEQWNSIVRGELMMRMTDNGNGVKFDRKLKKLDYSKFLYLRILLNFEHKTSDIMLDRESYRVVEVINEILV
jgi:hypothetical protein